MKPRHRRGPEKTLWGMWTGVLCDWFGPAQTLTIVGCRTWNGAGTEMRWIAEDPWPGIILLAGVAGLCLILRARASRWLVPVCLGLAGGLYLLEQSIVTSSERIQEGLESLRLGFVNESQEEINRWISEDSPELRQSAMDGLKLVSVSRGFHLQNVQVQLEEGEQRAVVELRGNGIVTIRPNDMPQHASTRWKTTWVLKSDRWQLVEVRRLNPVTGDEIGVLSAQ